MLRRILVLGLLCFGPASAFGADIMFEGYYRIELEKKHIGYSILRYSFDSKTKTFLAASFLRAQFAGKTVQEGLKATCSDKFNPISYQYTSQVGDEAKTIDANFKGEIMTLKITDAKQKLKTETYKIPKGTFLSTFLPYLLLQQKLKVNEAFKYSAVAEEEGNSYWGKALLQKKEAKTGYEIFTILNKYNREEFTSTMAVVKDNTDPDKNVRGEVLSTDISAKNISTRLVPSADKATADQVLPNKVLLTLFGGMPIGKINLIAADAEKQNPPDH